jgi:hypothetical protein
MKNPTCNCNNNSTKNNSLNSYHKKLLFTVFKKIELKKYLKGDYFVGFENFEKL